MLCISKKNQLPKTQEDLLGGVLTTKTTPIRNYSTSNSCTESKATRHSRISYSSKPQPNNNQSDDKGITSRTFSINEVVELPTLQKATNIILKRPQFLPRPKQQLRKLVHVQTSPTNFCGETNNQEHISYETINICLESPDIYILYKGFRNISQFNKITIITYNLLFGEYNTQFFIKQNCTQQKQSQWKSFIMRIKSDSILILQLNKQQKLNSLPNSCIDQFDCIFSTQSYNPKDILSHQMNSNHLWINVSKIQNHLKISKINQFIYLDIIYLESVINLEKETFQNKILLTNDDQQKLLHIYFPQQVTISQISQKILSIIKTNQIQEFQKLNLKTIIQQSIIETQQMQNKIKHFKSLEELKQKAKQHIRILKQQKQQQQQCGELRAEKIRDIMVEYIKSKSQSRIPNMHFIIGDTIMRNIEIFRNHDNDQFYQNQELVQLIDNLQRKNIDTFQIIESYSNYAFYYL